MQLPVGQPFIHLAELATYNTDIRVVVLAPLSSEVKLQRTTAAHPPSEGCVLELFDDVGEFK